MRTSTRWLYGGLCALSMTTAVQAEVLTVGQEAAAHYGSIQAAIDAASDGDVVEVGPGVYHESIGFLGKAITVRSTNGPEVTILDGSQGPTGTMVYFVSGEWIDSVLDGFTITRGAELVGGGALINASGATIRNCIFVDNFATHTGGAIQAELESHLILEDCLFLENEATNAGAAVFTNNGGIVEVHRCTFTRNFCQFGLSGLTIGVDFVGRVVDCDFYENTGGGPPPTTVADAGLDTEWVNCVFSGNIGASHVLETAEGATFINCTFSQNEGQPIKFADDLAVNNCIFWGNQEGAQISSSFNDVATVSNTCIQGGWSGPGRNNIDTDPLFVNPSLNDVRLADFSPCLDAGDNTAVPLDIVTDLAGNARIQNDIVDMGVYEGAFEGEPLADGDDDLDALEAVILIPGGTEVDPLELPATVFANIGGPDNSSVLLTQYAMLHGFDGVSEELTWTLRLETSIDDGAFLAQMTIPFEEEDLLGHPVEDLDLLRFDMAVSQWVLGVSGNVTDSPGHDGPAGDRFVQVDSNAPVISSQLGDYGVYYDPQVAKGFVWANLDHAGDFGVGGQRPCPGVIAAPTDATDAIDLAELLGHWGEGLSVHDLNRDEIVDILDVLILLGAWGTCD